MSGGSHNYGYRTVENEYCGYDGEGKMYDAELNEMMIDIVRVLKAVEWWKSCDADEEHYRETVKKFKEKWFKGDRAERLRSIVNSECEKLREELLKIV